MRCSHFEFCPHAEATGAWGKMLLWQNEANETILKK
jgi:hypothetical protein